jgi:antitoxin ParD1/3/4
MDNQNLDPDLEAIGEELVESGRFTSRADVLREGVRLVQERELGRAEFRKEMARRMEEADAGHVVPAEQVFDELEQYVRSLVRKNAA